MSELLAYLCVVGCAGGGGGGAYVTNQVMMMQMAAPPTSAMIGRMPGGMQVCSWAYWMIT